MLRIQSPKVPLVLQRGSGAPEAMPMTFSAMKRLKRLCSAKLASGGAMLPSLPSSSLRPSSRLRRGSPCSATISARARAFSSAIFTPVGQTSLQTRQPEQ